MKWTARVSGLRPALALLTIYCSLRELCHLLEGQGEGGGLWTKGGSGGVFISDDDGW